MNRQELYNNFEDFFSLHGNCVMKLTPDAAIKVCQEATNKNLFVLKIEGGIWHNPGFEARIDCIWDSLNDLSKIDILENNQIAIDFIIEEQNDHNAFILTIQKNNNR